MGSGGSKACCNGASSSNNGRKGSSRVSRVLQSSCLRPSSADSDNEDQTCTKNGGSSLCTSRMAEEVKTECYKVLKDDNDDCHRNSATAIASTQAGRFNIVPGDVSFRLSRTSSVRACPVNSSSIDLGSTSSRVNDGDSLSNEQSTFRLPDGSSFDNATTRVGDPIPANGNNSDARISGAQDPSESNVRFSRTLSVGRLRDRVLRRSSPADFTLSPFPQDVEVSLGNHTMSSANRLTSTSTFPVETREARYHDLLEHRSNFLERRRRIRSQVRALQRMGSRFENFSGHERSCILAGQNRTGRCTCRATSHTTNSNSDPNARSSLSRIVMLAEALFEVLDEIHQHSVVLSSRPSVSSTGSVPAPSNVVDSLPVKLYTKSPRHQNEEAAQCYICLVEYEDEDNVRILPCHHEFHRDCVDKWLKEIHRVCPLCRRDICKSESLPADD